MYYNNRNTLSGPIIFWEEIMGEKRYIISDASKLIEVEAHVLRYWEEELDIEIPRNEMGHRYYTDYYIELFKKIKELKDNGFQLKAIKLIMPELSASGESKDVRTYMSDGGGPKGENCLQEGFSRIENRLIKSDNQGTTTKNEGDILADGSKSYGMDKGPEYNSKLMYFREFMSEIIARVVEDNNQNIFEYVDSSNKDMAQLVIKQMDYLMRLQEEQEEERYKRLDETIRAYQRNQKELANYKEKKNRGLKRHR